jgi:PAS domain S-box-containing protein
MLAVFKETPFGICEFDAAFRFHHVNTQLAALNGLTVEDLLGRAIGDVLPRLATAFEPDLRRVLETGEAIIGTVVVSETPANRSITRSFKHHYVPVKAVDGAVVGITCVVEEITERRVVDRDLRLAQSFLDNAGDAAIGLNHSGRIVYANTTCCQMLGYSPDEILTLSVPDFDPNATIEDFMRAWQRLSETGPYMFEATYLTKTGTSIPVEVALRPFRFERENMVICLSRDISKRKSVEAERNNALADAEKANQAKSEFLATMSHELRTPLNAICGFSEMLIGEYFGALGSTKYKEYAGDIRMSSEHLLLLINDILDLAVIESGEKPLSIQPLDVVGVIDDCSPMIYPTAERKGVACAFEIGDPSPVVHADRRAIKQILLNILANAVKFTPEGCRVWLTAFMMGGDCVFEINDTGEGVPMDKLQNLTDPYVRVDTGAMQSREGTGLGLWIVKALVDLHNGKLTIDSEVGQGTKVTVRIPSRGETLTPSP